MAQRSAKTGKYVVSTVRSFEKESGVKLNASNRRMRLSTYIEKSGMPGMARALRTVEKEIVKPNPKKR